MGIFKVSDVPANGDDHISAHERTLWSLVYSCLWKYGCPVIFHQYGPHAQHRMDRQLTFFVPRDNPQCEAVKEYLAHELADQVYPGEQITETEYVPGAKLEILEFEGIDFYLERDKIEEMSIRAVAALMAKIEGSDKKLN